MRWPRLSAAIVAEHEGQVAERPIDGLEIYLHVGSRVGITWHENGAWHSGMTKPGCAVVVRNGAFSKRRWDGEARFVRVGLSRSTVEDDDVLAKAIPAGCHLIERDVFLHLGQLIGREIKTPLFDGDLLAETAVAAVLARFGSGRQWSLSHGELRTTLEYLVENTDMAIRVADLAERVGLSPFAFARGFKRATGLTPYQFSLRLRIERAKTLLNAGGEDSARIAVAMGFHDESHFSRTFKRLVGLSPARWRRTARGRANGR